MCIIIRKGGKKNKKKKLNSAYYYLKKKKGIYIILYSHLLAKLLKLDPYSYPVLFQLFLFFNDNAIKE